MYIQKIFTKPITIDWTTSRASFQRFSRLRKVRWRVREILRTKRALGTNKKIRLEQCSVRGPLFENRDQLLHSNNGVLKV